ncbi:MAG: hypothetical protein AAF726_24735 [Planctomycetota bacterium]
MLGRDALGSSSSSGGRAWFALAALVLVSALLRVGLALGDEGFDAESARGLLRSDPAELAYLAGRVEESNGRPPDWSADPRIVHGTTVDVPATYAVGQEWLLLAAAGVAPDTPPHVRALWVSSLTASLLLVGLFGALLEVARSRRIALAGAVLWAITPAAYRTIGFLYVREDLALPVLALGVWATLVATRTSKALHWSASGALVAAAMGLWHGASVGAALLALGLVAAALRVEGGKRGAWAAAIAFVLVLAMVPATRSRLAMLGVPGQLAVLALVLSWRRGPLLQRLALGAVAFAAVFALQRIAAGDDLAHVTALLSAKLAHAGSLPADPRTLDPDVRLMWQGPFATLSPGAMLASLGALVVGVLAAFRSRGRGGLAWQTVALAAIVLAWLARRNVVFAAPVLVLCACRAVDDGRAAKTALRLALGVQAIVFLIWLARFDVQWLRPVDQIRTRSAAIEATALAAPSEVPVLADSLLGPALLADHGRPIHLQAKWETRGARDRVNRFLAVLYGSSIDDFLRYQREEVKSDWLLFDGHTLWALGATRYAAGLAAGTSMPPTGSAIAVLVGAEGDLEDHYEVLWRESDVVGRAGTGRTGLWLGRLR